MPVTPEDSAETVEDTLEDVSSVIQEQIEAVVAAHPIRSLVVAFVAGVLIGKLVL